MTLGFDLVNIWAFGGELLGLDSDSVGFVESDNVLVSPEIF